MPAPRTSVSHPLEIATIDVPGTSGAIDVTFCPGKKDAGAMTGAWARDLARDIDAIRDWNAAAVVCLMEDHELQTLGVRKLAQSIAAAGMAWFHLPIRDVGVPIRGSRSPGRARARCCGRCCGGANIYLFTAVADSAARA